MSIKKYPKQLDVQRNVDNSEEIIEVLKLLQNKLMTSNALNGGFDSLLVKIEKIEEIQSQVGIKIDSIHDAIYDPDEGLFARVKGLEIIKEKIESINQLEKEIIVLQHQYNSDSKKNEKESKIIEDQQNLIRNHENQITELSEFKKKVNNSTKFLVVTIVGLMSTVVGKILYDFVTNHITLR